MNNNLVVFRHWDTEYNYPNPRSQTLEEAFDLTPQWIDYVKEQVAWLLTSVNPEDKIVIWSSSMPRAMHTAKVIREVIKSSKKWKWLRLRISTFNNFQDIINFEPYKQLFIRLSEWWTYIENWVEYYFDKKITNPNNISVWDYFFRDAIYQIDLKWADYPNSLFSYIKTVESNKSILRRLIKFLKRIKKVKPNNYKLILVSHWSYIFPLHRLLENWTPLSNGETLWKGDYIEIKWDENGFYLRWSDEKQDILQILEDYFERTYKK